MRSYHPISSISSFFKEPAGSMAFLLKFVLGAGTGMVLFSRFISYLFTPASLYIMGTPPATAPRKKNRRGTSALVVNR